MTKSYSGGGAINTGAASTMSGVQLYATAKVLLIDAFDHTNRMSALFNPQQLSPTVSVQAGRLHPVSWSHPIKQYAYTQEVSFTLDFKFTRLAVSHGGPVSWQRRPNNMNTVSDDINAPVAWLTSFCYGEAPGRSPIPIFVVWPKTFMMMCTVDGVSPKYTRWAPDGRPVELDVSVKFSEIRQSFKTSGFQRANGWLSAADEGHTVAGGAGPGFRPGRVKMGGTGE